MPMLLGEFVRRCEAGVTLTTGDGVQQFQEDSMSDGFQTPHETNGQPAMTASAGSPSPEPEGYSGSESDVIADAEAYLRSYLSFPDGTYYLPLALFAALMPCWDECFDEVPYLSVGAAVKAAGKTRVVQ